MGRPFFYLLARQCVGRYFPPFAGVGGGIIFDGESLALPCDVVLPGLLFGTIR